MRKIKHIIIGWFFYLTNRHNELANKRLPICLECEHRIKFVCGKCGCALQAKARIKEEECPEDKW